LAHRIVLTAIVLVASTLAAPAQVQRIESDTSPHLDASNVAPEPATWKGAFADSLRLLMIEHAVRIAAQQKTRVALGGPFMRDMRDRSGGRGPGRMATVGSSIISDIRYTVRRRGLSGWTMKTAVMIPTSVSQRNTGAAAAVL
jgi:hypothetical protein